MKVAVTTNGKNVAEQFGRSNNFMIYELAKGKIKRSVALSVSDSGGGKAIMVILRNEGVDALLCGNIQEHVKLCLEDDGIEVVDGLKGSITSLLKAYSMGNIKAVL